MFLELLLLVIVVGIVVILSAIPKKSFVVNFFVKSDYYFPYHMALSLYTMPLGKFGKTLRDRSFTSLMESVQDIYVPAVDKHKKELFADLTNAGGQKGNKKFTVLEIGIGAGGNFKYYPKECDLLVVEPNAEFDAIFTKNLKEFPGINLAGKYQTGAEDMSSIKDSSVDAVITTLVLCSIGDVDKALREIFRVLKPGGKYYLLDHMGGHKQGLGQKIFTTLIHLVQNDHGHGKGSGCGGHDVQHKIKHAGFSDVNFRHVKLTYAKKSKACEWMANHRLGIATK